MSSSTVTYICITEECASDKCAEIAAFFLQKMLDMFEDNEDVQNVWHNWEE